jgi:hypothetical protein
MTRGSQFAMLEQECSFIDWHFGRDGNSGGRSPDFEAIRGGEVFEVPLGPLVSENFVRMFLDIPRDIQCFRTTAGASLRNPLKVV